MMKMVIKYVVWITCILNCLNAYAKEEVADFVLVNGTIWTVNEKNPEAQALAIKKDKFLSVGSNTEMTKYIGKKTKIIDLKGKFVLPGFIDSHTHFLYGGFSLFDFQLRNVKDKSNFINKIAAKAKTLKKGDWILNGNWDHQQFDPVDLPKKEWIDSVTRNNPVCINRIDGHMVLVNSLALKMAGITKDTPSPEGGEIQKDPITNQPTGILKDAAVKLINQFIPEPSQQKKLRAALAAIKHANALGVTSIHDMAYVTDMERYGTYLKLLKQKALSVRIAVYMHIKHIDKIIKNEFPASLDPHILKIAGVKGFVDGALGSSTALFFKPYKNTKKKMGVLFPDMIPAELMKNRLEKADKNKIQVAIHAIGDKANHQLIDIFQAIKSKKNRRWRVEHAQHQLLSDIKKMAKLNVIASIQPYHLIDDARWMEAKLGKERSQYAYRFADMKRSGVKLSCGSDWTVAPLSPLEGIYAAVTRQILDSATSESWFPEQKISLKDAIQCYTLDAAYAEFAEDTKGSIESGKYADLVVLDRNLFKIPTKKIKESKVLMTIFNGRIVYQSNK